MNIISAAESVQTSFTNCSSARQKQTVSPTVYLLDKSRVRAEKFHQLSALSSFTNCISARQKQ
ncbi:hypothetical protein CHS0354_030434, partial [Potamilus streckersoni]